MTPESKKLLGILKNANVDIGMAGRGVTLTTKGNEIVARLLGCDVSEVPDKLLALSQEIRQENARDPMAESNQDNRFSFESDILGNVTLRDSQTGAEKHLKGDEAFKLLQEIGMSPNYQGLIAPYFTLGESATGLVEDDYSNEMHSKRGTYNFPFRNGAGTALYVMRNGNFDIDIVSLRDQEGNDITVTDSLRLEAEKKAMSFIDHA